MTEIILKTGWKHWDKYLSKFVGKKINCLDIGSYTGVSTCWMLDNLCSNPYSRVFSVDTWEGSAEYTDYTDDIERRFDEAVKKTGKKDQHVKMKMKSSKALLKLKQFGFIIFDFIFIDASHEAKDVITDAILSWDILNEEGILIFDDYKWDKLKGEEYRPKLAIDSFVAAFKPQLKTLFYQYQYIVEKIKLEDRTKPELDDYYKLLNEINNYNIDNLEVKFYDKVSQDFDFKLKYIDDNVYINKCIDKIYNLYNLLNKILISTKELWINNSKFNYYINKTDSIYLSIKNKIYEHNIDYNLMLKILYSIHFVENIFLLNSNDRIIIFDNYIDKNLFNIIYDIYHLDKKYKISFNDTLIRKEMIDKLINKKYKFIYINSDPKYKDNSLLIFNILILLNIQQINGKLVILLPLYINIYTLSEFIFILKKYYIEIKISKKISQYYGKYNYIECINFVGINNTYLNKINNLLINLPDNKLIYNSILNITNNKLYDEIIIKLLDYIDIFYNKLHSKLLLLDKIVTFINNNQIYKKRVIDTFNKKILLNLFKILYVYYIN
jgi:predicted O-methyltransferase YrrM